MVHGHPQNGEAFQMANINFAQYVKADFDYAKNFMIDERNSLVFHVGLGLAYPYGNSKSLPFENCTSREEPTVSADGVSVRWDREDIVEATTAWTM